MLFDLRAKHTSFECKQNHLHFRNMFSLNCKYVSIMSYPNIKIYLFFNVPLVEQDLITFPENLSSPPVFSGVRVTRSLVLCVCFVDRCLSFFFWSLCCLFFLDLRILIIRLVSSNSSSNQLKLLYCIIT